MHLAERKGRKVSFYDSQLVILLLVSNHWTFGPTGEQITILLSVADIHTFVSGRTMVLFVIN